MAGRDGARPVKVRFFKVTSLKDDLTKIATPCFALHEMPLKVGARPMIRATATAMAMATAMATAKATARAKIRI